MKKTSKIIALFLLLAVSLLLVGCGNETTIDKTDTSTSETPTTTVTKTDTAVTTTEKVTDVHEPIVPVEFPKSYDFTDANGITWYGWNLVANETNQTTWDFGEETGMVLASRAAEGDTANQRVFNYALRNILISGDDEYSVSCTFTPDSDSDLSVERTYGIVVWYQDSDNYLIYWLQQKTGGDWSGQFYGRVGGAFRKMYIPESYASGAVPYCDYWRKGEYYDLWWDQSNDTNPELLNQKNILLTQTVTLKVVSKIGDVTVNGETSTCRYFELHQIVNNVDFTSSVFYVQQINEESGDFYTGIYSECFSFGVSDYKIETSTTDFTSKVAEAIDKIPAEIKSNDDVALVIEAQQIYNGLLEYKDDVASEKKEALSSAIDNAAIYVDSVINALDSEKSSYYNDVNKAYQLYIALPDFIQDKVTEVTKLAQAIKDIR